MSAAGTVFALTFVVVVCVTLFFPSFPPAQLLCEYVKIPQTTLSIWGISVATLLNGITNGFFWTIIVTIAFGLVQLAYHASRSGLLPPMPVAPHLASPLPENPLVDSRVNIIPPALTVPPESPFTIRGEPMKTVTKPEPAPLVFSRGTIGLETDVGRMDIETIEGVGLVCGGLLRNLGICTVSDLLKVGVTERGRHRIANEVGVNSGTVLKWVYRGDLLRVRGIGRKYSALLESAGVNTVGDLSTKKPHYLCQTLKTVNRERKLVGRAPPCKTIEVWVYNAKNLKPLLVE